MNNVEKITGYYEFEDMVKDNFKSLIENGTTPLYLTDVEGLWETYLNNLPLEHRQHFNCNTCRHFISRYGNLAILDENKMLKSALWSFSNIPDYFKKAFDIMSEKISNAVITGVFLSDNKILGQAKTGEWTHLHAKLSDNSMSLNNSMLYNASQMMAQKLENRRMVLDALGSYSYDTITKGLDMLKYGSLYRADTCLPISIKFTKLAENFHRSNKSSYLNNLVWEYVALNSDAMCHIKSSMLGTLLEDIESKVDMDIVTRNFENKMSSDNYMRSQSAPTQGNVDQAESIIRDLNLEESLERRYATFDEISSFIWKNSNLKDDKNKKSGIFSDIQVQNKTVVNDNKDLNLPIRKMTWEKFNDTILKDAIDIEAKVEDLNRLMALITSSNTDSKNILKWDNRFSWYYNGGRADGDIKERVLREGGKYEDNDIRCSLIWNTRTDLDLHCITPNGNRIYYHHKKDYATGGYLDVDMNVRGESIAPVENIRFEHAIDGLYKFIVNSYTNREPENLYKVEIEIEGEIYTWEGNSTGGSQSFSIEFLYTKGKKPMFITKPMKVQNGDVWNIKQNEFVKVKGITLSPNLWNNNDATNKHVFFLLEGCKDNEEGKGKGFFNEMLISELKPIRKTLEAYMSNRIINRVDNASACGLGYSLSSNSDWNLTLKVKTKNSTRLILIDRFE